MVVVIVSTEPAARLLYPTMYPVRGPAPTPPASHVRPVIHHPRVNYTPSSELVVSVLPSTVRGANYAPSNEPIVSILAPLPSVNYAPITVPRCNIPSDV